ncbi:MAG: class I SAM-dependent methyltransferase [Deltaproteobacteria bacterium]|jgi:SAM-dependent methyltransferase|nr:class I SAM-dependent methyltransferase [Deltaproteobacteria bacterium]
MAPPASPYENPCLARLTGSTLRPGGLALTEAALAGLALAPGAALLDIGCGPGETLALFARSGHRAHGLDPSRAFVRQAAAHGRVFQARAENLPLDPAVMDAVFCECVLSLSLDKKAALAEMRRVLSPGGFLVLADLYSQEAAFGDKDALPGKPGAAQGGNTPPCSCLDGAISLEDLEDLLKSSGFAVLRREDHSAALRHLAACIVFAHGSLAEFQRLLHGPDYRRNSAAPCTHPRRAGYVLFISQAI